MAHKAFLTIRHDMCYLYARVPSTGEMRAGARDCTAHGRRKSRKIGNVIFRNILGLGLWNMAATPYCFSCQANGNETPESNRPETRDVGTGWMFEN